MESIPKDKILQFNSDTMLVVRKMYNLDKPGQMDEAVDLLDDWLKKQNHFTKKDFSREYLERTIIMDKGSVERAKIQLDKLFTLKTLLPIFFEKFKIESDFQELNNYFIQALLPKLTSDNYRVYAAKIINKGITPKLIFNSYELFGLLFEYMRSHDYCCGVVGVVDYRDVNFADILAQMDLSEFRQILSIIMDGYKTRIKGIHFLTTSKTIEMLVNILKQVLPKGIGERIIVHKSLETLHDYIPKEVLPTELGGDEKSLQKLCDEWVDVLNLEENRKLFNEMHQARTDESLRPTSTFNEQYMGMAGTFRTLSVD